ncbi:MAG: 50S ribosomal protein L6 [Phycisphaerales bacterium]|nr:50S ribosomal protein L6 [Phycisphaerales bacterium]
MSRIGKKTVDVPKDAKVAISGRTISIDGPKGSLSFDFRPEVEVNHDTDAKQINVTMDPAYIAKKRSNGAYWGTTRALIANMVEGVTKGYERKLEIVGVGWTCNVQGQELVLKIGFANLIKMPIPAGLTVTTEKQQIVVTGADKQAVGHFAASTRAKRKPEPYNGKGIKYTNEVIQRKQGKAFGK